MAVRVDTSGVSATKVRPTEERAYIPKIIYCLLVYKCLNVYTYTLSAYLPVGRSVRPSIHLCIHYSIYSDIIPFIYKWFSACLNGKYGPNCREICGHCYNNSDCYHGNGTCLEGCDPGYWNHECKTRTFFFYNQSLKHMCAFYDNSVKFLGDFIYKNNAETFA